jgi:diguanylate cyclase (GGDEF)-like protein
MEGTGAARQVGAQSEREFFRNLLASLTDSVGEQGDQISQASLDALMAGIAVLADREAELIRIEAGNVESIHRPPTELASAARPPSRVGQLERRGSGRATLAQVPLLKGVSQQTLSRLQEKCDFRDLAPDEMLLGIGHSNQDVYLILSGSVRVHLDDFNAPPYIVLGTGECVGEISTLGQTHATAHVLGNEAARLMVISQPLLWDLIDESPEFARNLLYTLSHRLRRDNQFLRRSMRRQRESERHANLDPLTGLDNRRSLNQRFGALIQECASSDETLSLLMIDVDHFKRFNDTHGHLLGDEVLCAIAGVLSECGTDGVAARYGGEEFALVLPRLGVEQAAQRAEAIRAKLGEIELRAATGETLPAITVSIGIAQMEHPITPEGLFRAADAALYCAKRQGRDRVVIYDAATAGPEGAPLRPN